MYSVRHFNGEPSEMLNPSFRTVNFSHSSAQLTMAYRMRQAWMSVPPPKNPQVYTQSDIGAWTRDIQEMTEEEVLGLRNPELTNARTPWRAIVYEMWNHVFWDVMKFLPEVGMGVGTFSPPNHDILEIPFGGEVVRTWETNVLIIPTFLKENVKISMYEGETKLGAFDGENEYEIWWLRKGTQVKFTVEGEGEGLSAVLMLGILDTKSKGSVFKRTLSKILRK